MSFLLALAALYLLTGTVMLFLTPDWSKGTAKETLVFVATAPFHLVKGLIGR